MLESINILHKALNREEISYCHWKSNEHLTEALNGDTDLDMLFLPEQRDKIDLILNKCGLKRFRTTPNMQYNAIEDYIGFDRETAKIWHLHLHYRLTLGEKHLKGYTTPWGMYLLKNRIHNNVYDVYCSNPNDELCLLYIRIALKLRWRDKYKKIGKDDLDEINWLKERTNTMEILSIVKELLGDNLIPEFEALVNSDISNKSELVSLQKKLRKNMRFYTSNNKFTSLLKRSFRETCWIISGVSRKIGINLEKPKRRISPSGGAVVVFLGSDGAGKSTTIDYVKKEFGKKIDVKNIYMGSGDGSSSILRYPLRLIAKRVGGKGLGRAINSELTNKSSKPSFKSRFYLMSKFVWGVTLALEKRNKLKKITKSRNNGILVLADRYPQVDTVGYNDGPLLTKYRYSNNKVIKNIAEWEYNIYESAYVNAPDLIIKLMVPIEVALERKPEMTEEEISNKIEAVRKIDLAKKSIDVYTNKEKISSFGEVMANIWKVI